MVQLSRRPEAERFCVAAARAFAPYHRGRPLELLRAMRPMAAGARQNALAERSTFSGSAATRSRG